MSYHHFTQTLVNSFNALADEFQNLTDRKTILEHKLRFAHEQFQYLADKYAPAAPEITDTLAKLQVPPELHHPALEHINFVPLPKRHRSESQHQIALLIREGRKAAQRLSISSDPSKDSGSTRNVTSLTTLTTLTTAMEQDFTVQGKKGNLGCPFQPDKPAHRDQDRVANTNHTEDPTPHHFADPICAAMYEETMSSPPPMANPAAAQKCPIRYMDQHSPEEIAQYVEKHKHEIPRSHEVCLSRYQRSEDQIRKLDAKYGSLVAMIQDLSHLHKPMLPLAGDKRQAEVDRASNQRVENWAQDVSATEMEDPDKPANVPTSDGDGQNRESHFDRPLKEVRVGESPSRPWGISVPVFDTSSIPGQLNGRPESPPPAPVMMPLGGSNPQPNNNTPKCPFGHRKINARMDEPPSSPPPKAEDRSSIGLPRYDQEPLSPNFARRVASPSPAFINPPPTSTKAPGNNPQMLFTGPVFIGYPIDQAIQFMQHFQSNH